MFYAVHTGRHPGVYSTWSECQKEVIGFPNAKYKKFSNQDEALSFISGVQSTPISTSKSSMSKANETYELWTDGSAKLNINAGYGWVLINPLGEHIGHGSGKITSPPYTCSHAELTAIFEGLRANLNIEHKLVVKTDSQFIVKTINEWGPKRSMDVWKQKAYGLELHNLMEFLNMKGWTIEHVRGHQGLVWNEYVDGLAKEAANS